MDKNEKAGSIDPAELDNHHAMLKTRAEELRKQLDKGVPQAEFKQLHLLSSAVKRAIDTLEEIRADLPGSS